MQKYYPQNTQSIDQSNFNIAACDLSNVLLVVVFVFNVPPKANNKVIWRQGHQTDW